MCKIRKSEKLCVLISRKQLLLSMQNTPLNNLITGVFYIRVLNSSIIAQARIRTVSQTMLSPRNTVMSFCVDSINVDVNLCDLKKISTSKSLLRGKYFSQFFAHRQKDIRQSYLFSFYSISSRDSRLRFQMVNK